ncbi:MAG: SDR family oxidoreductase [Rhizobiaceae bacterium]
MTQPRTILVTSASSGIGAHCARALKAEGWRVFATARRDADIAALTADGVEALPMDYRDQASIARLVDEVAARTGGRLDALFNNGGYSQVGAVEDLPVEALREQFEANFFGWHELTRRVIPLMRAQGHGRIVSVSSILGLVPMPYRGAYVASKHALEGLMLCLRAEMQGSGIHVSLIEPGPLKSRFGVNGISWLSERIDSENSVHRAQYEAQMRRMLAGGSGSSRKRGPEAVHAVLRHALLSSRPRPHYFVTWQARLGVALKRVLPAALFYRLVASTS